MKKQTSLDRIDRAILKVLQDDGRITNALLADAVGLSPSACLARVRRLEKAGVITGYKAQVNPARIASHLMVIASIRMEKHDLATSKKFETVIRDMPEVIEASYTSGSTDYIARLIVPDVEYWAELQEELIERLDLRIDTIVSHIIMRTAKHYSGIPLFGDGPKDSKPSLA